ncbi:MAG TPA: hypothetical protein VGK26_00320 [Thermoanaerobaculia bacterium]|jgi:hypothetical protein
MTKIGSLGSKKQAILLGVLAVVLVLAVVRWRPGGGAPAPSPSATSATKLAAPQPRAGGKSASAADEAPPPPSRAASRSGSRTKEVQADDVPILDPDDFEVKAPRDVADAGRDLFDLREPTRKPPPTPFPPPPPPGDTRFIGPLPAPGPTPTPKPPEITFKFVGTFGPKGHPIAVIQEGDKVYNVRAGDVLFDKFVLRSVGYESIDIGFVGYAETESRRIGITPN